MNMITTENLSYSYTPEGEEKRRFVFSDLNLEIEKGSFTAILGHNGCGKSTLAKHFNAILLPSGGSVSVLGMDTRDAERLFEIRKNAGMVFQNPDNQIVSAVVEDEVAFAPENLGVPSAEIRARVDEALRAVGMEEYRKASPAHLSGGQKQRIAIAGVLAMHPACIILDEPTAMLDPQGREEVLKTIRMLNREKGMTVIFITHYMEEAAQADRVIVMREGTVVSDGCPREVFRQVEELKKIGLTVPQVTELFYELRKAGIDVPEDIITVEEGIRCLSGILMGNTQV